MYEDIISIPIHLPPGLLPSMIQAVRRAHDLAADDHVLEDGYDNQTYGTSAYRLAWYHIEQEVAGIPGVSTVRRVPGVPGESFRVIVGHHTIGVYTGNSMMGKDPYAYDFSRTPRRAHAARSNQPLWDEAYLAGLQRKASNPADLRELHLVHYGDPLLGGCQHIHLGAPTMYLGNETWGWVERVWALGDERGGTSRIWDDRTPPQLPSHDELQEPQVELRLKH